MKIELTEKELLTICERVKMKLAGYVDNYLHECDNSETNKGCVIVEPEDLVAGIQISDIELDVLNVNK